MIMNYLTLSNGLNLAYDNNFKLYALEPMFNLSSNNGAIMDIAGLQCFIHNRVT